MEATYGCLCLCFKENLWEVFGVTFVEGESRRIYFHPFVDYQVDN